MFFFFFLANVAPVLEGKREILEILDCLEIRKKLDFFSRLNWTNFAIFWEEFGKFSISQNWGEKKKKRNPPNKKEVEKVVIILEYLAKSDYKPNIKDKSLIILLSFWLHTENQKKENMTIFFSFPWLILAIETLPPLARTIPFSNHFIFYFSFFQWTFINEKRLI